MVRQQNNKRGFSPENLLAGLNIDKTETDIIDSIEIDDFNTVPSNIDNLDADKKLTLDDLVKKSESKKLQENVYLHENVKQDLELFGKLVGKVNGGKSYVTESALIEYFEKHKEYLDMAREKFGKK